MTVPSHASLLGIPYDDGDHDCYGLCRRYYHLVYDIELPNYARSSSFFAAGIDQVDQFLLEENFSVVDVPMARLQPGDGLLLCIQKREWPAGRVNHLGVFVGDGKFIHHMWNGKAREDYMDSRWFARVLAVLRNPQITLVNDERAARNAVDLLNLLPTHARQRYGLPSIPTSAVLDSAGGESGPDPS